ncbi:MAG: thiamine pyrophosphate-binding protein [Cyanobacteriota bacterium]|nr:thiamine pyrophosphate-binding protein [Cyanobacteriota bacterium]
MNTIKLSDWLVEKLVELGYQYCYFVAGGNIMHLLNSVRTRMVCVPFAHEVGAAIAAEYHNASIDGLNGRAFALVTAGPGLTNALTAVAGAWQESRELLLIGGQVKVSDLARGEVRQRGIQEVDGVALTQSITKGAMRLERANQLGEAIAAVLQGQTPRKGPVFLELPLDVQALALEPPVLAKLAGTIPPVPTLPTIDASAIADVARSLNSAERPIVLVGGGVSRPLAWKLAEALRASRIPLMTTYNGADRIDHHAPNYFGRPNTWGMRYANILLQQADFILALGTRLGLQQTGFNWQQFAPLANLVQVDIDPKELNKGHPQVQQTYCCDADNFLLRLAGHDQFALKPHQEAWLSFCQRVKAALPLSESTNSRRQGFLNPYDFWQQLSSVLPEHAILVPCSSGSSFTSSYQAVTLPQHGLMLSNKSQAAMGYGLSGAIGAALANPDQTVFLVEGDGGFLQNLQELVVAHKHLNNLRIFLWVNRGYASIRQTQRNYFGGAWLGCDEDSGLGFPDWQQLFTSFGIACMEMSAQGFDDPEIKRFLSADRVGAILVPIDPEQTYFPKISSRVTSSGGMESNPLHLIGPPLSDEEFGQVSPHLPLPSSLEQHQ